MYFVSSRIKCLRVEICSYGLISTPNTPPASVIAGIGGTQRMTPKLIGRAKSMQMHLTGRMMDAQEASNCGLVAQVHPDETVLETALQEAVQIAEYAKPVAMFAREAVHRTEEMSLAEGLLWERRVFHALFGSHAQREGMAAFLEKRDPNFRENKAFPGGTRR